MSQADGNEAEVDRVTLARLVDAAADQMDTDDQARVARGEPVLAGTDREMFATFAFNQVVTMLNKDRLVEGKDPLGPDERIAYEAAVAAEMWHSGAALERWFADPSWENLDMNGFDRVWVTRADGRRHQVPPLFRSDREMLEYISTTARRGSATSEQRFDPEAFFLSFQLDGGFRLSAVWGGRGQRGVAPRPLLNIRQHHMQKLLDLDELNRLGSISDEVHDLLRATVAAKLCVAIVGDTDAGKTALLRAMAMSTPSDERLTTIEDSPELQLAEFGHQNVAALETRKANSEGKGSVELAELVRLSLRMNPGRVLLGEVLGPSDVTALLNAMSQGNKGSMCTYHAYSADHAFSRLISLCSQPPVTLPLEAAGRVIADALDLVVYVTADRNPDGSAKRRYVASIREVGNWDGTQVTSSEVCSPGPDGVAVPSTQFITHTAARLDAVGYTHRIGGW
ncbi:MAG: CpaF family protein [Acidimicrobiales bacterium]